MTLRPILSQIVGRRLAIGELWLWCTVLAGISYWAELLRESPAIQSPLDPVSWANSIFGAGAFTVAAWAMVATRAGQLVPYRPASLPLIIAALGLGLLCVIPARQVTGLILAGMGIRLLLRPEATRSGRQAGLLLLALAGTWLWGRFFTPLQVVAAEIDAHVVGWVMNAIGFEVLVNGNLLVNGDHGIEVLVACSSTYPLAEVVLAFVVITLYLRGSCLRADLPWLLGSLATSVVLTEIRLVLMALNGDSYQWWHFGPGSSVYGFAALVGACVFPLLAALRGTDPGANDYRLGQTA
jgi:hypothetical protein